jgi:hypothetical protein
VSVRDEIFPAERRLDYVQTEWAEGWTASAAGFGYAAEFLTKHARAFGATIDQAGLVVFFLQRHRVELVLKNLLGFLEVDFKPSHSLQYLWELCRQGFAVHHGLDWATFERENGEFVKTLIKADNGATNFRFPVDRDGEEVERPRFIDLDALNRYADKLLWEANGCMDFIGMGKQAEAEMEAEYAPDWNDL